MRLGIKHILAFVPPILVTLTFFYYPIIIAFSKSTQDLDGSFIGFDRYSALFANTEFTGAFVFTMEIALISTIVSVVLSIMFVGKRLALFLNQMNISMPHMIVAVMVIYLLSQKGFVSILVNNMGMTDSWMDFPQIVESSSPVGAIISYCLKFTPFICMSVLAVL